jgi:UDP-glucose 4-epimerase
MRCTVLGGRGFIGRHLVAALTVLGHEVSLSVPTDADVLFYLASTTTPVTSNLDPEKDIEENLVEAVHNFIEAKANGIQKIIYASSGGAVYGPCVAPVYETSPTNPTSSYGITKLAAEKYLALLGIPHCILRMANVYGPGQPVRPDQGVLAHFLARVHEGEPIEIRGDGRAVRDYVHVADAVESFINAMDYPGPHTIFNIGSGRGYSVLDIVAMIQKYKPVDVRFTPAQPCDVPINVLDIRRAQNELFWCPTRDLETFLKSELV